MKTRYTLSRQVVGITAACLLGGVVAGCADPKVQERIERREANMQQTIKILRDDETSRPERLQFGIDFATARCKQDPERFRVAMDDLRDQIKAEQDRWRERQPEYREAIQREFGGDLQRAADTLPEMLY